jgi:hypothetical protein
MIIRIFDQGRGLGGIGHIDYLLDKEKHQGYEPQVTFGNPEITKSIISNMPSNRKNSYVAGVIALRDDEELTEKQQQSLINRFIDTFAPIDKKEKINFLFVRHQDKGNLELHFVCPRTLLKPNGFGKAFNLHPPGKANLLFFESFTRLENYRFGFEQVDRKQMTSKDVVFFQSVLSDLKNKRAEMLNSIDFPKKFVRTNRKGVDYGKQAIAINGQRTTYKSNLGNGNLSKQSKQPSIFNRAFKQSSLTSTNGTYEHHHKNAQGLTGLKNSDRKNECGSYCAFQQIGRTSWEVFGGEFNRTNHRARRRQSSICDSQTKGLDINEELRMLGIALIDCDVHEIPKIQSKINELVRRKNEISPDVGNQKLKKLFK